jgi:hypothetical protein
MIPDNADVPPSDSQTGYIIGQLLRLAEANLPEDQLYGLIGRLTRVPGVAAELDAALTEIERANQGDSR